MSNVFQSVWGFLRYLWEGLVLFFKEIKWFYFLKGAVAGSIFVFVVLMPWTLGVVKLIQNWTEQAGYTAANLHSFNPTVKQWWMAENGPIVIVALLYTVFALAMYIWINSPLDKRK